MSMQSAISTSTGRGHRPRRLRPGFFNPNSRQYTKTGGHIDIDSEEFVESAVDYTATEDRPNCPVAVSCDWLGDVEAQLEIMRLLPDGWDSYRAPPPDLNKLEAGASLLACLCENTDLPRPYVNPTPSGGVQFEWEADGRYFELEIVTQREAAYLFCDENAHVEEAGEIFEGESLDSILALIRKVTSPQ